LATPLDTINRTDETADIAAINQIISQHQVGKIIIGLPRSMDGSIGSQAEKVRAFAEGLGGHIKVPLEFRDERLSTVSAKRLMRDIKKTSRRAGDDAVAAAIILQAYLDEARL
jgi:putative Holliday junction resolvase